MRSKIEDRKITITPRTLRENEKHCEVCGGTGWMYVENDKEKYIEKCNVCDNGIIHICPDCGKELGRNTYCNSKECRDKRETENQLRIYEKATKYTLSSVPKESIEYFYSDLYGYDEGYFSDIDSLEDYCKENNIEIPKFVFGTKQKQLNIDAYDIVESALEEWYEDAIDRVDDKSLGKLQSDLDDFCKNSGVYTCYEVDYSVCVELEELN